MTYTVERVRTGDPNGLTLRRMGETAKATADTFTVREWMARIATKAPPKDYREQLRLVFDEIVKRWRYVMETGEWIHGTPRSLLAHVLGARYNRGPSCPSPERCDVENTPWRAKGWGDCDDVATLAAACALGLGLQPFWRVSRGPSGAHVAVTVRLPSGQTVEVDPVVWPERGFDWAPSGPATSVEHFSLSGAPITMTRYTQPWENVTAYRNRVAPPGMGTVSFEPLPSTYLGELMLGPFGAVQPYQVRTRMHVAAVHPSDRRGARVLAVPAWHSRLMRRGMVWDGTPAVDQFGQAWTYRAAMDAWLPSTHPRLRSNADRAASLYYGRATAEKRAARKARRRRTFQKIGRVVKKVGQAIRKVASKVLSSKFVQTIVAGVLQVFGVPMAVTRKLMAAAGGFIGKGGLVKLLKLARKSPKEALTMLAGAVKQAGQGGLLKQFQVPGFSGVHYGFAGYGFADMAEPTLYEIRQDGGSFYGAPVEAIVGMPGVFEFGQAIVPAAGPTPGRWYRVQFGDTLSEIVKAAYGQDAGVKQQRWLVKVKANAPYLRDSKPGYEQKYIGPQTISLLQKYPEKYEDVIAGVKPLPGERFYPLLYIPATEGDEPAAIVPTPPDDADDGTPLDVLPEGDTTPVPPTPVPEPSGDDDAQQAHEDYHEDMPPLGPIVPEFPDGAPQPPDPGQSEYTDSHGLKPIPWDSAKPAQDNGATAVAAAGLLLLPFIL